MAQFSVTIDEAHAGQRIDQAVPAMLPEISRSRFRKAQAEGGVFVNRKRVKIASKKVFAGQKVQVHLLKTTTEKAESDSVPQLPVVAETPDWLIIDKPSGLFSAPTPESDQRDVLHYLGLQRELTEAKQNPTQLFLVHRLDRPTSGLMLIAKTKAAARHFSEGLQRKELNRRYLAVLCGAIPEQLSCDQPLTGQEARTHFRVVEKHPGKDAPVLVEARLETGRTHQIRQHAELLQAPVAGDSKYGRQQQRRCLTGLPRPGRLALHAHELAFTDLDGQLQSFSSPLPAELQKWWHSLAKSELIA
ncbi:MAG: RluA family pseudouridine synthase [Polyangiaceae bacterium]|nr:RluA family pseudouridine synthase [Polyangiaceae bacterium]